MSSYPYLGHQYRGGKFRACFKCTDVGAEVQPPCTALGTELGMIWKSVLI
jgi:hypothetical protein